MSVSDNTTTTVARPLMSRSNPQPPTLITYLQTRRNDLKVMVKSLGP
jgi:hypothetical protein